MRAAWQSEITAYKKSHKKKLEKFRLLITYNVNDAGLLTLVLKTRLTKFWIQNKRSKNSRMKGTHVSDVVISG